MNQIDMIAHAESGRKLAYEKPALVELGEIRALTLGGLPSSGIDTQNCTAGAAQHPPESCM